MSLEAKIMSLLSGVVGADNRIGVAASIKVVAEAYLSGRLKEEELRGELYDIVETVIAATNPDLTEDEVREKSRAFVEDLVREIKVYGLRRRVFSRLPGL